MCGIFCSLCRDDYLLATAELATLLKKRGPDSLQQHQLQISSSRGVRYLTCLSTVLALRGDHITIQPLIDQISGSILCWNGEAWEINHHAISGNDSEVIFDLLLKASAKDSRQGSSDDTITQVDCTLNALNLISGPFSFVYYDGVNSRVFYGRDRLGRRSLLRKQMENEALILSSICDGQVLDGWVEVEADGIYYMELSQNRDEQVEKPFIHFKCISWDQINDNLRTPIMQRLSQPMNKKLPNSIIPALNFTSPSISALQTELCKSLRLRILDIPTPPFLNDQAIGAKVAILFSGGLDCTLLARLAHDILPVNETIDLLNVAFENPRIIAAAKANGDIANVYDLCPDRITGKSSHAELERICPERRWRHVSINIPYSETLQHREIVKGLIYPHNTEMDFSIAIALYFAARGSGIAYNRTNNSQAPYTTKARVLLSGLGADEIFGGYTRHNTAFSRRGFQGLVDELDLDINRLGKRNLGRDDRAISHWGKEVRYPYLDEKFMNWALSIPVWEKCGFGTSPNPEPESSNSAQDRNGVVPTLQPGKKILRLLAWKKGMKNVAKEGKRAIQFGARTAKMEKGRTKGTQILE
ncbi:MAG: hypothetical protein M1834_008136 [Cirrosporium novae-zelandiae]|nr:MAG: hypothetical protein M1834_008136 [Cirrosporium novae-zelandiae]